MKLYYLSLLLFLSSVFHASAQQTDTVFLEKLMRSHYDLFKHVLEHPTHNEVQVLYTQIDRDKNNIPHFSSYSYRLNPKRYFYPASTVKLPTAIFALEKLNTLNKHKITKHSAMLTDSAYSGQTRVLHDSTAQNKLPSISHYIKKILLVSDNDAYNRLYEFIGRQEINAKLKHYNLLNTRIVNRLAIGDGGENAKHTNPVDFYDGDKLRYHQQAQYDPNDYPFVMDNFLQGKGYLDRNDKLVMQPYDFSKNNIYVIADQQMVLKRLMFPEAFSKKQRYQLTDDDYQFIYKYMSMYPTESAYPSYGAPDYYPTYCKFLFYGSDTTARIDPNIRIFNKIGDSYGYNIDNAYIVDFKNKVEFMITAVVQSNEDGIYNDNKYEYTTVCLPFLKNLAQTIYKHELSRPKKYKPNLSKLQKISYRGK